MAVVIKRRWGKSEIEANKQLTKLVIKGWKRKDFSFVPSYMRGLAQLSGSKRQEKEELLWLYQVALMRQQ